MQKTPYDPDIDKLLWMRHNLSFNIALTSPGFTDEALKDYFDEEPVWIVASHVGFHLIFQMLGLDAFCDQVDDAIPRGFHTTILRQGPTEVEFRTYNPEQ